VAAIALDSQYGGEAAKPPISVHPAFPAIVALWFAALLGIGSLVLPAVLLDRVVSATGLAALLPAASPPLGMTARSIIAIAGALGGAALGVAIARRVAQAHGPKAETRVAKLAGGSRRPISVHDELGGEGLVNGRGLPLNRRRALAISEDDRPSDFLYRAPLPGENPEMPAPFAAVSFVAAAPEQAGADHEPLELCELAHDSVNPYTANPAEPAEWGDPEDADEDFEMPDSRESASAWPSHQHYPAAPEVEQIDRLDTRKNLAGPRGLEPLPFAAPSLARRAPQVEVAFEAEATPTSEREVQLEAVATSPTPEAPEFRADWETAPLDGLGLVQLVQRLGSTIERRRDRMEQAPARPVAPIGLAQADFDPAPAEEAVQAMAAFFGSAPPAEPEPEPDQTAESSPISAPPPQFLRSLSLADEDDDEDDVPDFSLPLLRQPTSAPPIVPAFAPADNDAAEDEAEDESEEGCSSLLGMNNPFAAPKSEFVRIEEPEAEPDLTEPAVVFPGTEQPAPRSGERMFDPPGKASTHAAPAAQAPADADAALRAALATLQRMSGAA